MGGCQWIEAGGRTAGSEGEHRRVNLNSATLAELEALPGTRPVLVRRIMEARPLQSVDDLGRVKGIGVRGLQQLRPMVRVE